MTCPGCEAAAYTPPGRSPDVSMQRLNHCPGGSCKWKVCRHRSGRVYVVDTRTGRAFERIVPGPTHGA